MPALKDRSVFRINDLSKDEISLIFSKTRQFKKNFEDTGAFAQDLEARSKLVGLVFLEPSTRTRSSFEVAALRLGYQSFLFEGGTNTSLSKGESSIDTVKTIEALKPDLMVVRHGGDFGLGECLINLSCPVINAGSGVDGHPTQALLDAFTILESRGKIEGEKVLMIGDIKHSRVASSGVELLSLLGAEVGYCGPKVFYPEGEKWNRAQSFSSLEEGLEWASVCMPLRIQLERHGAGGSEVINKSEYCEKYRIDPERLRVFKEDGIIMNPGPYVPDVELTESVLLDPRSRIREQVTNGMFVRASLLNLILEDEIR